MPIRIDDVKRQHKEKDRRFEPAIERAQGVLLGLDSADSAEVRNRPGFVWYRRPGSTSSAAQALNRKLLPVPGLPVILQRVPPTGSWEVVDVDANTLAQLDDYQGAYLDRHAREHEPGGNDPLYVYLRMITPLRTTPGTGVSVSVAPLVYDNAGVLTTFGGNNNLSLSASVPGSGLARYVLVYLDPATNTLTTANGDTAPNGGAVALSFPAVPAGAVPSAYVRLEYGQTTITESNIVDARLLLNGMRTGTGEYLTADGSITGATSQAQDFGSNGIETDAIDSSAGSGIAVADDLLLASGSDVYPNADVVGLRSRLNLAFGNAGATLATIEDFEGSLPSGWSWAGSPFVTPLTGTTGLSQLVICPDGSGGRAFYYNSTITTANHVAALSLNSTTVGAYGGLRWDDGTDNNYFELRLQLTAANTLSVVLVYRTGGGTPVSTTQYSISLPIQIILRSQFSGTQWSSWNVWTAMFYQAIAPFILTAGYLSGATWTPTRWGIVAGGMGATWQRVYVDWVL